MTIALVCASATGKRFLSKFFPMVSCILGSPTPSSPSSLGPAAASSFCRGRAQALVEMGCVKCQSLGMSRANPRGAGFWVGMSALPLPPSLQGHLVRPIRTSSASAQQLRHWAPGVSPGRAMCSWHWVAKGPTGLESALWAESWLQCLLHILIQLA